MDEMEYMRERGREGGREGERERERDGETDRQTEICEFKVVFPFFCRYLKTCPHI